MFKIENMAGLTARIGRHFFKLMKPNIRHNLRHMSYIKTFNDNITKKGIVMTTVAAGVVTTSIAGYVVYTRKQNCSDIYTSPKETSQTSNNKFEFTASPKGEIIGDVTIEVGPTGTTVECRTDLNGGTNNKHVYEKFKNDKFKFIRQIERNPEILKLREHDDRLTSKVARLLSGKSIIKKQKYHAQYNQGVQSKSRDGYTHTGSNSRADRLEEENNDQTRGSFTQEVSLSFLKRRRNV